MQVREIQAHYLKHGKATVDNVNLLTLITGKEETARKLLSKTNFLGLGEMSIAQLQSFGLTKNKAILLQTVLEIGRRRQFQNIIEKKLIRSSEDAFAFFATDLSDLDHEQFHLLCLNKANKVIKKIVLSVGGTDATIVDVKLLLKRALEVGASSIMVAHNHPSGRLKPSQADINITNKIKDACTLIDITLLDHIIVGDNGYYSFADEYML